MAKQDVLDAINATIVENGQKGITAQALNNVLTMMTENAGEGGGSGDGVLRIMMPDKIFLAPACFGSEAVGDGFTPETWALLQSEWESIISSTEISDTEKELYETYLTSMNEVVPAMFAHNAKVYTELVAKAKSKEGIMVLIDQSASAGPAFRMVRPMAGDVDISLSTPAMGTIVNLNDIDDKLVMITSIGDISMLSDSYSVSDSIYKNGSKFALNPDGSIVNESPSYQLYLPDLDIVLNNEQTLSNQRVASILKVGGVDLSNVEIYSIANASSPLPVLATFSIIEYTTGSTCTFRFLKGLNLLQTSVSAEYGSTVTELVGTLNAPTA